MPNRKLRKKYLLPKKPWDKTLLDAELKQMGQYGLRSKRELRRFAWMVVNYRKTARRFLPLHPSKQGRSVREFLTKLYKQGLIGKEADLSDVLDITVEDLLERRLQTIVFRKGLANSIHQARQLITHGHISVDGRRVKVPSFIVGRDLEDKVTYWPGSPFNNPTHPIRVAPKTNHEREE
ncbi:MAG: 30S ribosomal protein S4 [Candidatus Bathyarchaeia archaeon]